MLAQEVVKYWVPVVRQIYGDFRVSIETCRDLDVLLGIDEYKKFRNQDFDTPLPEEVRNLLVMLAGPHGNAILKAYRIRKGLE